MSLHILVIFWLHARVFWRPDMVWLTKWPVTRGKPSSEAVCNSRSASCACPGWSLSAYFTAGIEPRWEGPMCHWDEATQTEVAADEKHSCGQDFPITPPPFIPHSWGIETGVNWGRASSRPHQRSISPDNSCHRSPPIDELWHLNSFLDQWLWCIFYTQAPITRKADGWTEIWRGSKKDAAPLSPVLQQPSCFLSNFFLFKIFHRASSFTSASTLADLGLCFPPADFCFHFFWVMRAAL